MQTINKESELMMKKEITQWEYEGFTIERGAFGYYVIDWDYTDEQVCNGGQPFKKLHEAENYILKLRWAYG